MDPEENGKFSKEREKESGVEYVVGLRLGAPSQRGCEPGTLRI